MKFWWRAFVLMLCFVMMYTIISLLALDQIENQQHKLDELDNRLPPMPNAHPNVLLQGKPEESEDADEIKHNEKDNRAAKNETVKSVRVKLYPSYLKEKRNKTSSINVPLLMFIAKENAKINQDRHKRISPPTCDPGTDCARLRKLLEKWPSNKPKAAFIYLTQAERLGFLKLSLESIDANFNDRFQYPVIIFHEAELDPALPAIRRYTHSQVFFQRVEFGIPDFLTDPVRYDIPCTSRIGYRHMCRFHAKGSHEMPIVQGLEYYWRLDDDSRLLRPVQYDVFQYMQSNDLVYGYVWKHWDANECTTGLWEATQTYITQNNIKPTFFHEWPRPRLFYNNFEIAKLSIWLEGGYEKYIDYIDKLGGIYYHRWGDAPIKGLGLSLFVPKNKTHQFADIGYEHAGYRNQ